MPIKPLKTHAQKLYSIIESDMPTDEKAMQLLGKAYELYEQRAVWAVVAQVYRRDGKPLKRGDLAANNAVIGVYPSATEAMNVAKQATYAARGKQAWAEAGTWVIPFTTMTASAWHKALMSSTEADLLEQAAAEKISNVADASSYQPTCEAVHVQRDTIVHCTLPDKHDGPHLTEGLPDGDSHVTARMLTQTVPPELEELFDETTKQD